MNNIYAKKKKIRPHHSAIELFPKSAFLINVMCTYYTSYVQNKNVRNNARSNSVTSMYHDNVSLCCQNPFVKK